MSTRIRNASIVGSSIIGFAVGFMAAPYLIGHALTYFTGTNYVQIHLTGSDVYVVPFVMGLTFTATRATIGYGCSVVFGYLATKMITGGDPVKQE
jgi:hypothetical protein